MNEMPVETGTDYKLTRTPDFCKSADRIETRFVSDLLKNLVCCLTAAAKLRQRLFEFCTAGPTVKRDSVVTILDFAGTPVNFPAKLIPSASAAG